MAKKNNVYSFNDFVKKKEIREENKSKLKVPKVNIDENSMDMLQELICLKCYHRYYHIHAPNELLSDMECSKCGEKGYVISTGQIFDDEFIDKVMMVADELSKLDKEDLEELMKENEEENKNNWWRLY